MYVIAPVDNGSTKVEGRLSGKHNPIVQVGDHVKYKTKIYKVIAIVHEEARTVLYVQLTSLEAILEAA